MQGVGSPHRPTFERRGLKKSKPGCRVLRAPTCLWLEEGSVSTFTVIVGIKPEAFWELGFGEFGADYWVAVQERNLSCHKGEM